ncbi:MAG: SET domain-containing protein [Chloroflexi bacterium]|nr:MAG: SET domain-containing protein [Chloroflexota bacterium]
MRAANKTLHLPTSGAVSALFTLSQMDQRWLLISHHPKDTWMSPKIHLVDSLIQGNGLQAIADIEPGETVLIWRTGYTDRAGAMAAQQQGKGIMQWDENVFSYDAGGDDEPYAINHSCDPNTWMADAYTITARRAINIGDEITIDYGLFEMREDFISSWTCQCGTENCRGHVTGNDWKVPQLQQRYAGHFSPLINGWIQSSRISAPKD